MKTVTLRAIKLTILSLFLFAASAVSAQDAKLEINNLDKLEARAEQVIDVNIDSRMLQFAAKFLSARKPDEARIKELVAGLRGVYVKSFDFDKDNQYSMSDIEAIRRQLSNPAWSRMVNVRSKRDNQNIEVYTMLVGNAINGLAVIASQPDQLTIVNIVGPIDMDKLAALEGNFGIPRLDLEMNGDEHRRNDSRPREESRPRDNKAAPHINIETKP
jgi:hypothetical protein